jgi:hypothetical protein
VEGDIDIEKFPTREDRDRRTDEVAFFYWKNHGEEWVDGIDSHEQMPPNLRGRFSWKRLEPQAGTNSGSASGRPPRVQ